MSDDLLRQAMIVEARKWLEGKKWYGKDTSVLMADFLMHMTGGDAPELRYVESCALRFGVTVESSSMADAWEPCPDCGSNKHKACTNGYLR